MKEIVLIGRILFSLIFVLSGFNHFSPQTISYAQQQNIIMAGFLVPASGLLAILSGLSIMFGFHAKIGAWGIVLFLFPVTMLMHKFWTITDPMQHMIQMSMFMKNTSMMGAALIITYFGAGPLSFDNKMLKKKQQ